MDSKKILYGSFVIANLALALYFLFFTFVHTAKDLIDFPIFYGAAKNAIQNLSIYTYYGPNHLPYWLFPWVSWIFIPLAVFSTPIAEMIYFIVNICLALLSINSLANHFKSFRLLDRLYMFSILLWMSWLVFRVGQLSFIILFASVLIISSVIKGKSVLTGLLIPILLIKPHLFLIFIPLILWIGGWKTLFVGTMLMLILFGVETLINPHWMGQMLNLLLEGAKRVDVNSYWNISTFPTLLGFSQNYVGTANLPITIVQVAIAVIIIIRFHSLPKPALLSLGMAASLFCAPRTYAYDLVFLIPAMVWLSEPWSVKTVILWAACAAILIIAHYSSGSYFVTMLIFTLSIIKAFIVEKRTGIFRSFFGQPLNTAQ